MKKGYWRLLILVGVIAALSGCGKEGDKKLQQAAQKSAVVLKEKYRDSDTYIPQKDPIFVNMNESIRLPTQISEFDDFEKKSQEADAPVPFIVYEDCDLTRPLFLPDTIIPKKSSGYSFSISPSSKNGATKFVSFSEGRRKKETFTLLGDNIWGIYDTLYLVQNNDLDSGRLLEKPYIYLIKINHSAVKMTAPEAKMSVTDDGQLNLEWDRVKRARYYLVIREWLSVEEEGGYLEGPRFDCLEKTKSTKVKIPGYKLRDSETYASDYKNDPAYNTDLELRDKADKGIGDYRIFVVAVNRYKNLSVQGNSIFLKDFGSKIPIELAWNTFNKEHENIVRDGVKEIEDLPDRLPMTMADGSVYEYTLTYSIDKAQDYAIWYKIDKTPFKKDAYRNELSEEDEKLLKKKNADIKEKYGSGKSDEPVNIQGGEVNFNEENYSDSIPVNKLKASPGSREEEYLGANIIAGKKYIDLAAFPDIQDKESLRWLIKDVEDKNILLPEISDTYYSAQRKILQVTYHEKSFEKMQSMQDQVISIVNERIHDSMDELEKVKAINGYLTETASFDYDAFAKSEEYRKLKEQERSEESENFSRDEWREIDDKMEDLAKELKECAQSFNIKGVLLNQKGTSESYAEAFAALVTQAGLACICVTGEMTSGEARTWNYVKMNGTWRAVDAAGNETESSGNTEKYLNLALNDPHYMESYRPDAQFLRKYSD